MEAELPSLDALDAYDHKALKALYQKVYPGDLRQRASVAYLRAQISWLLQARLEGIDIDACHQAVIEQLSQCNNRKSASTGTRLVREWHGEAHHVEVLKAGFYYRGQRYRSLSEIARQITGARWSGPRFFGLKGKRDA